MKELFAYVAGLIDGEGTITLSKGKKTDRFRYPCISLTSTSKELVQVLRDNFGGTVCNHKTYKSHHKPSWSWSISHDRCLTLLENIRPYMLEIRKCQRVDLLLSEYKSLTKRNGKYSSDDIQRKFDFETRFFHPSNS